MTASCVLSIHAGESAFSLLIRYSRWTSTDLQYLAGNMVLHRKPAFRDLPIAAAVYERQVSSTFQFRQALLTHHSAALYFASSIPAPFREETLRQCTARHSLLDRISLASAWSHLRFCPRCAEQEFRKFRYSWWHRDHQLPLSLVCTEHECQLIEGPLEFCALSLPHELTHPFTEVLPAAILDECLAICRLEQYLATSVIYTALDIHVYHPLQKWMADFRFREEAEERLLKAIKKLLIRLRERGQKEAIDDWDMLRFRIIALMRNGAPYCDPMAAVLVAIACRRLYLQTV